MPFSKIRVILTLALLILLPLAVILPRLDFSFVSKATGVNIHLRGMSTICGGKFIKDLPNTNGAVIKAIVHITDTTTGALISTLMPVNIGGLWDH